MNSIDPLRRAFNRGVSQPIEWRIRQLDGMSKMLQEHQQQFADALFQDLGKHYAEAWTTEIGFTLNDIARTRKNLRRWLKPRQVSTPLVAKPGTSKLILEPLGVVLVFGAWNYPLQLSLSPVVSALAAGNCVVLKPSEVSPATSALLATLLPQFVSESAVSVIEGDAQVATELLQHRFDHIFYTGGAEVGKIVMRAAAEFLTPVTLELGGKSPVIVTQHCDIKTTARRIAWGKWMNAGQTCIAPDYILVESSVRAQLVAALEDVIYQFFGAEPQRSKDYGRIVNDRHFSRLMNLLEGQHVINQQDYDRRELYMAPMLIDAPAPHSDIMNEEIFGPLLPICSVESLDEALSTIRERPKPLACYAFTSNYREQARIERGVSCGNLCFNDTLVFMLNPELPFGGVGDSGMGRYHGEYGLRTFSHEKPVMKRSYRFDVSLRYPPYSKRKLSWLKKLM